MTSQGYVLIRCAGHPLAYSNGWAYEHRVVFHDSYGAGPFKCEWCGDAVSWETMHVDHRDDDRLNNHISNLSASCALCNMSFGREKSVMGVRAKMGRWIEYDGQKLTVSQWAKKVGISQPSMRARLMNGWPLERALTEGRGLYGPQSKRQSAQHLRPSKRPDAKPQNPDMGS